VLKLLDEAPQAAGIQPRWDRSQASEQAPYGVYNGLTLTEAAGPNDVALGYLPTDAEWRSPNFYEDTSTAYKGGAFGLSQDGAALPEHQAWFFYLMRICNHCTYPTCLAACPRKAIYNLAVLQLFRTTQKMIFRFEIEEGPLVREVEVNGKVWQMYNDTVIGFDAKGREAVRLSVVKPLHERPMERLNSI
jgi:hypothetical protein